MLLDRVPSEAEFQPDLDVSTSLSVELLSALEVIAGEASPAAGRLRSLAACGTDSGLCDADLRSDLADSHVRAGQVENLLLLRRADRAAGHVAVGATLAVLGSGVTSPAMRRLRKASRGFQLFVSSLLKRTTASLYKPSLPVPETSLFLHETFALPLWEGGH